MSASGIIAAGVTVSMLLGGLDLSQMATMAMSGIFVGLAYNAGVHGVGLLFVAIGVGLIGGIINGLIMNYLHIDPIITTLGTQLIFRAVAYIASNGNMIKVQDDFIKWIGRGKIIGIPVTMVIMIFVYVVVGIVLKYTRFGRNVISVGGSSEAAYLSGINVKKTRAIAFMISGACAGLATMLYIAQGYVAQPNQGSGADIGYGLHCCRYYRRPVSRRRKRKHNRNIAWHAVFLSSRKRHGAVKYEQLRSAACERTAPAYCRLYRHHKKQKSKTVNIYNICYY